MTPLRENADIIALGLGFGMLGGLVQATLLLGFDGLSLVFGVAALLLVYFGGKQVFR